MGKGTKTGRPPRVAAGVALLTSALVCAALAVGIALAQLDLSVFQKEGTSEEQQSKDRYDCHRTAVEKTGFDPAVPPPDDIPPMRAKEESELKARQAVERRKQQVLYNEALRNCMEKRGYTIAEH